MTDRDRRWVYAFGESTDKRLLGGKGAGLSAMTEAGLPVPPGFTITTDACNATVANDKHFPDGLWTQAREALAGVERATGRGFGDRERPLLVSVRSGAAVSMPGMMDTVLNLGLNDATAEALAKQTGDARFAWDAYRRFVAMFGEIVMGVPAEAFERVLSRAKARTDGGKDTDLSADDLREVVATYKRLVFAEQHGQAFPEDPEDQLRRAIAAVFDSWDNDRAAHYRRIHRIPDSIGTAVNVQAMVFGNMGWESGTGVAFTRDPSTGENVLYGEFLRNAQGEDVVAGTRTPLPISQMESALPEAFAQLTEIAGRLEAHYRDVQDIEFTVEQGTLWLLQTRTAKRTGAAAVRVAVEMVGEGAIEEREAVLRVEPAALDQLLHPSVDPEADAEVFARGLPASPGAAQGVAVFDPDEAERRAEAGEAVILVRQETSPDDFHGMAVAKAIVTARGGMTCVAGDTGVLTDRGLLSARDAFALFGNGVPLRILSFDSQALRPVWRAVVAAGRKPGQVVTVAVSQTGRAENNTLQLTADHKMVVLENRALVKKPLGEVLTDRDFVTVVDRMPALGETATSAALAYVAGAIFSDGYINLKRTKGSVTFIQKPTPEKADFIAAVERSFEEAFGVPFSYVRQRETVGEIRGAEVRGSVEDQICFRREPAARLSEIRDDLDCWVLSLGHEALLHFLAGFVDGDGTYSVSSSAIRIQISVSRAKREVLSGLALACLRLGIVPQITSNRHDYSFQIAERVDDILAISNRICADVPTRTYASKCLSVGGLFRDIVDDVNHHGRVREGIKRNLLFGTDKLRRDVLPLCTGEISDEVGSLLDAPVRSYRVRQTAGPADALVYNFEVEAERDLDKTFVAFSSRLTPILVSNSHAAVVARGMGTPCVAGAEGLSVDPAQGRATCEGRVLLAGEWITVDGSSGRVLAGQIATIEPTLGDDFHTLMGWADAHRRLGVRANADTPEDAETARGFGAAGIGLCRTEHMFFGDERLAAMREMILADGAGARETALRKLLPLQREDFAGIFRAMDGHPVTVRLLDPPLHEFLPDLLDLTEHLAELKLALRAAPTLGEMDRLLEDADEARALLRQVMRLRESNPMLGFRGCRLGMLFPEITRMQARALFEAALQVQAEGVSVHPEIMVPLVSLADELADQEGLVRETAEAVFGEHGTRASFLVGTMIELPRACLTADAIAEHADFFSFGTNDLTQTTFGLSRDDAGRFLSEYVARGVLPDDPFQTLDVAGVGALVRMATERGRGAKPGLKVGICGEHGGDPASVAFCHEIGLDYVSCSPYRVPIARLAAAHAALS